MRPWYSHPHVRTACAAAAIGLWVLVALCDRKWGWSIAALMFAPVSLLVFAEVMAGRRAALAARRARGGQCTECGYDRAGLGKDAVCPECGAAT